MYSTFAVIVMAVLTCEMMQDYDVGSTAIIGAISTALAMPTDSHLDWSALVRRRTRLRPSSDHLSQDLHVVPSTQIGFSHRFALLSVLTLVLFAQTSPRWCHLPHPSLLPAFAPSPSALPLRVQLSPFAGSFKSRSHLRLRTSRRTIAIARAVDTPR